MHFEHGGNIFVYSKKLGLDESEILDFSVNLNPFGFPEYVEKEILKNIKKIYHYPEIYSESLKERIADFLNCDADNIVIGNGSTHLIYLLPKALNLTKPVIINPTFSEYRKALKKYQIKHINYNLKEEDNFKLDVGKFIRFLEKKDYCSVFLCNPSNPVGVVLEDEEVSELARYLNKKKKIFIIDEAFIDFTDKKGFIGKSKNVVVLKSLTKIFGIPGLRLGYLKSYRNIAKKVESVMEPWSVNILSLSIGERLLKDLNFIEKTKKFVEKERQFIVKELAHLKGLKIFDSETNYLFFKILNDSTVDKLESFLLERKILIRNCSNYVGLNNKFFRIGFKQREENLKLIKALKIFFNKN